VEQGTRLTRTSEGEFDGVLGFLGPALFGFIRSSQQIELSNIKRLVEGRAEQPKVDAPIGVGPIPKSLP
jgi:hypothetical protein